MSECRGGCGMVSLLGPGICEACRVRLEQVAAETPIWCVEVERRTTHSVYVRAATEADARRYAQDDIDEGVFVGEWVDAGRPQKVDPDTVISNGVASFYCAVLDRWVSEDEIAEVA